MAGIAHDTLLLALKNRPALLVKLLRRLTGLTLPGPLQITDSVLRSNRSLETAPDLVLTTQEPVPGWVLVEIQNKKDETKGRSWHLATSVLLQGGAMGDLIVLTASRAVARWAKRVAQHRGNLGTTKALTPVVLHLSKKHLDALLDPHAPELALFAVWARCRGAGPEARRVAEQAVERTIALPDELQEAQMRAILGMLNKPLLEHLTELSMDINQIKENKTARALRLVFEKRGKAEGLAEGESRGKRNALFAVLTARGLTPTPAEQERLATLTDLDVLDRCLQAAATCTTLDAVLQLLPARQPLPSRRPPNNPRPRAQKKANGHHR